VGLSGAADLEQKLGMGDFAMEYKTTSRRIEKDDSTKILG